jgi:hydrogenase nickel incorporation protein HypA/HybF
LHEFSAATALVETILDHAKRERAEKVLEVHLLIGKLTLLQVDQLSFCYEVITKGTIMQGSKLIITESDIKVKCTKCRYTGAAKYEDNMLFQMFVPTLQCPACGGQVQILGGHECVIKNVRYQRKKDFVPERKTKGALQIQI